MEAWWQCRCRCVGVGVVWRAVEVSIGILMDPRPLHKKEIFFYEGLTRMRRATPPANYLKCRKNYILRLKKTCRNN
jgi:hypothetical protein